MKIEFDTREEIKKLNEIENFLDAADEIGDLLDEDFESQEDCDIFQDGINIIKNIRRNIERQIKENKGLGKKFELISDDLPLTYVNEKIEKGNIFSFILHDNKVCLKLNGKESYLYSIWNSITPVIFENGYMKYFKEIKGDTNE